ncbi:hypothetical protein LUZ60_004113 [Juncus effusus]|nr:hypothetical protein LUZ60_004113 [Juncus effusus]
MGDIPLHSHHVIQPLATINRLQILLHFSASIIALSYHASSLISTIRLNPISLSAISFSIIFIAEISLLFMWVLAQAFRYRPVSRYVFPERLPDNGELPSLDIFIPTADPDKEPTIEVMNTVLSAMALDYPSDKLHIYLSDDAGSEITFNALKETYDFAKIWVPFCERFYIQNRCPEVQFSNSYQLEGQVLKREEFLQQRQKIKVIYESFKDKVKKLKEETNGAEGLKKTRQDRPSNIGIIGNEGKNKAINEEKSKIPSLFYISREKRKNISHHYKAGALNVLLRVSGVMTNSPFILVLDCDMYSNDPSSAKQALCFHLDPTLSPSLAFVQFPQNFHSIGKSDIYCAELRQIFTTMWIGADGLRGPGLSGTNLFVKRDALYGTKPGHKSSRKETYMKILEKKPLICLLQCEYENETEWGEKIGFLYGSLVEDFFTGFHLHCRGWRSCYCIPSKPAFCGNAPISFNDTLVQNKRWNTGLLEVALSQYCPLTFGISRNFSSVLQNMWYTLIAFWPAYSFPLLCYGILPQLCFLNGVSLFPEVRSPWFFVFAFVFFSSCFQHLREVFYSKRNFRTWCNEQRFWMINGVTAQLFACVHVFLKIMRIGSVDFDLTNKTTDEAQIKRYQQGIFDFEGCSMMLLPATTLSLLNLGALIGGVWRIINYNYTFNELFAQFFLMCFILALSIPVIEGIIFRRDTGRVPPRVAFWSLVLSSMILYMFG